LDAKITGDIAEQAAILEALKRNWGVSTTVGDRLPYDLIFDVCGTLHKIQVKSAWWDERKQNYVVDNRRIMKRENYTKQDFDFALLYIPDLSIFYVMPVAAFIAYGSEIHLVEDDKRQRKPRSAEYREA